MSEAVAKIEPDAPVAQSDGAVILTMIDRLLARPDVPVEKLEQMFALHQKVQAEAARRAYLSAFAELQSSLPAATRSGKGHNQKSYARYEDVANALREPFSTHGFSHWFSIDQTGDKVKVTTFLGHAGGHVESSSLIVPLDISGGKTPMHALGSSVSYGKRYGLLTVTGIATEDDDDGKAAGAGAFITEDQQASLRKLLDDTGSDVGQFLQFANADNMGEIPARDYARLHGLLTKKKAQKGAK